jgi:hypothetical protein
LIKPTKESIHRWVHLQIKCNSCPMMSVSCLRRSRRSTTINFRMHRLHSKLNIRNRTPLEISQKRNIFSKCKGKRRTNMMYSSTNGSLRLTSLINSKSSFIKSNNSNSSNLRHHSNLITCSINSSSATCLLKTNNSY